VPVFAEKFGYPPSIVIVDVPALRLKLLLLCDHANPVSVSELAPRIREIVPDPVEENPPHEHDWPFVFNVPAVNVTVADAPHVNPSDNSHDPPAPLNVTFPNVFPALVTVN
jgi:hypothetical protein